MRYDSERFSRLQANGDIGTQESIDYMRELEFLVRDFVDDSECSLDHNGCCEEHGWFHESECPHGRAKAIGLFRE